MPLATRRDQATSEYHYHPIMGAKRRPGLFVIEGEWSSGVRDVRSVAPVLKALDDAGAAVHVRKHVNDRDDVIKQFKRWGQVQHTRYNIGYVALHGSPGAVHVGRQVVKLHDIAAALPAKALNQKILHFGSCAVLDLTEDERQNYRRRLGVKVMTGFTEIVDWFPSMAFELLLFDALSRYQRPGDAERHLRRTYGDLTETLGFVMVR